MALAFSAAVVRPGKAIGFSKQAALAVATLCTALVAVGLTSPADSPLSLSVHPVFLRFETSCGGQPRPHLLAVDVDLKVGSLHAHAAWPGFTLSD
jgi:hypothetical protein